MTRRLWIDTDLALGAPRGDVDDGFALAAALRAASQTAADPTRSVELLGISCVAGNTHADAVQRAVRALIGRYDDATVAGLEVVAQARAADALLVLPAGTTVLALGPPTNLASAADLDPGWPARVETRAVGTLLTDGWHPIFSRFCLNFRRDPEASRRFFQLRFARRVLYPIDVLWPLRFDRLTLDRIAAQGPIGSYLADGARRWLRQAPIRYLKRSFPVWDLVAALDTVGRLPGARYDPTGNVLAGFDLEETLAGLAFEVA